MPLTLTTSRRLGAGVALLLLAALALLVGGPARAATPTAAPRVSLVDCAQKAVVKPKLFTLTCGDANTALTHTHWSSWGGTRARARSTYVENDCTPNCASGRFRRYHVRVVAERLSTGADRHYRTIVVHFPHRHPSWVKHHRARFDVDFGQPS